MNYYRLHIGDYLRDASHLSLLEHGVYTRLLQVYYARESPISDAEKYRIVGARSDEEREAVDTVLDGFFVLADGKWSQSRCEREIAAYQDKAERNRAVGKLGGRPGKPKNQEETQTVSERNPDVTRANSQEPIAKETHTPRATAVELAVAMRQAGVAANSANPQVIALAAQGVGVDTAVAACEEARKRLPGESVSVGYVTKILETWAKRAAEAHVNGATVPRAGGLTDDAIARIQAELEAEERNAAA